MNAPGMTGLENLLIRRPEKPKRLRKSATGGDCLMCGVKIHNIALKKVRRSGIRSSSFEKKGTRHRRMVQRQGRRKRRQVRKVSPPSGSRRYGGSEIEGMKAQLLGNLIQSDREENVRGKPLAPIGRGQHSPPETCSGTSGRRSKDF